jgi:hypothetical protein
MGMAACIAMLFLLMLGAAGCSVLDRAGGLIGIERTAPAVAPAPQATPEHLELRSAAADFSARVLARVYAVGAQARAALVDQALRAAEAVSADVGKPAESWVLPPLEAEGPLPADGPVAAVAVRRAESVESALLDYSAALGQARRERAEWEEDVGRAAATPSRSSWRLSSPALGTYLLFGIGGVGAALLALGRWAWKWRKVALQIIPGVQGFVNAVPTAQSAPLLTSLSISTDAGTKKIVTAVQEGSAAMAATPTPDKVLPGGAS